MIEIGTMSTFSEFSIAHNYLCAMSRLGSNITTDVCVICNGTLCCGIRK